MKKGGKMKTIGGLKDILECPNLKLDEQIMVEVVINQKRISLKLSEFRELLFREDKTPVIKNNISELINSDKYKEKYGIEMLREFIDYWTEKSPNGRKMRWQKQKTFDVKRRMLRWQRNNFNKPKVSQTKHMLNVWQEAKKIINND